MPFFNKEKTMDKTTKEIKDEIERISYELDVSDVRWISKGDDDSYFSYHDVYDALATICKHLVNKDKLRDLYASLPPDEQFKAGGK